MRRLRRLLLFAILAILVAVGANYYFRRSAVRRAAPAAPKSLPADTSASMSDWRWAETDEGRPVVEISARSFRQVKDPPRIELQKVELRIYSKDARQYDQVRCATAEFDTEQARLYSPGEVELTMGVAAEGQPPGRLVLIRTSGVTFETRTGKASTDRPAAFTFDMGDGKAVGVSYDPQAKELHLAGQVELFWRGRDPKAPPMKVEAGELSYKERDAEIWLLQWSRLTRGASVLEGASSVVRLTDGAIQRVDTENARGTDRYPGRTLEYRAEHLTMLFYPRGAVEKITGERNARLVSTSPPSQTAVSSDRVDLEFREVAPESQLARVVALGHVTVESSPLEPKGPQTPETRILRSETVTLDMRPGGEEIQTVMTHEPGQLEFLPNRPGQRYRKLDANRMWMNYGKENRLESFRAVDVATRTESEPRDRKGPPQVSETWSKGLAAEFEPKTGRLARMEQWDDFRYQEGQRKARAQRALFDPSKNTITLQTGAWVTDPTGSMAADQIRLDEASGDVAAEGNVSSTRLPDRKGPPSGMLSKEEPMQAKAARMTTAENNLKLVYEGDAVLWQGANRIRAARVEIDRKKGQLVAGGNVATQFVEERKPPKEAPDAKPAPSLVFVRAAGMTYSDKDRVAHYTGGAVLERGNVVVRASEIRVFLTEAGKGSGLEKALADGRVEMVQTAAGRTRTGTGEHGEYYAGEERLVLSGGEPALVDSVRGATRGRQLTYWTGDDRLLVDGAPGQPAVSRIRRR